MWEGSAVTKSSKSCSGLQDEHELAGLFIHNISARPVSGDAKSTGELDHFGHTSALMILMSLFVLGKILFE